MQYRNAVGSWHHASLEEPTCLQRAGIQDSPPEESSNAFSLSDPPTQTSKGARMYPLHAGVFYAPV